MTNEQYAQMQYDGMRNINPSSQGHYIECFFSVGDVVKLKSGGESMTVSDAVDPTGMLHCTYVHHGEVVTLRIFD